MEILNKNPLKFIQKSKFIDSIFAFVRQREYQIERICNTTARQKKPVLTNAIFISLHKCFQAFFSFDAWQKGNERNMQIQQYFLKHRVFSLSLFPFAKHIICINSLSIKILRLELCKQKNMVNNSFSSSFSPRESAMIISFTFRE